MFMEQSTIEIKMNILNAICPSRALLDLIADKWTMLVIVKLSSGVMRYGVLHHEIGGISHKMLS